jgi:hypothetical protein
MILSQNKQINVLYIMVGKIALTQKEGKAFVIWDEYPDGDKTYYGGIFLTPGDRGAMAMEENPRVLGDLQDLIDYQKLGDATRKLIIKEAEIRENEEPTKSLDYTEEEEELSTDSTSL